MLRFESIAKAKEASTPFIHILISTFDLFYSMSDYFIHPSSYADEGCQIGSGTKIWHFCHIMPGAIIGKDCNIGQNVVISPSVTLGNGVKVQNNVSIYTGVTIEDGVFLGPSMVFTNVINPRSNVNRKSEFLPTLVQSGASIGANATIVCGVTIGRFAFIGAGAVVTKNVADYALITGNPGRQTGWMSEAGFKLKFENNEAICQGSQEHYVLENGEVKKQNPTT